MDLDKRRRFNYLGKSLTLYVGGAYRDGTPVLLVDDDTGEPWAKLTVFVPGASKVLQDGQFLVKTWSENRCLFEFLEAERILRPTGLVFVLENNVAAAVCTVDWEARDVEEMDG